MGTGKWRQTDIRTAKPSDESGSEEDTEPEVPCRLPDKVFTRELWEMATECPVVFPAGIGVVPWMVPGGREIAVATSELMKKYDLAVWAHHGMFAAGEDFDLTFGLMHTAEKSAEILVKMLSMRPDKLQTITPDNFRHLAKDFHVTLPEEFLYEK